MHACTCPSCLQFRLFFSWCRSIYRISRCMNHRPLTASVQSPVVQAINLGRSKVSDSAVCCLLPVASSRPSNFSLLRRVDQNIASAVPYRWLTRVHASCASRAVKMSVPSSNGCNCLLGGPPVLHRLSVQETHTLTFCTTIP
jgi:hypothetical protein